MPRSYSHIPLEEIVAFKNLTNIYQKGNIFARMMEKQRRYNVWGGEYHRCRRDEGKVGILSMITCQQYLSLNLNGEMSRKIYQQKLLMIKRNLNLPISI